jgi:hypothetical protein
MKEVKHLQDEHDIYILCHCRGHNTLYKTRLILQFPPWPRQFRSFEGGGGGPRRTLFYTQLPFLHISLPHNCLFVSRDDSTEERLMDEVNLAEGGVFQAECEVRECQEKLEDEKMRLEGLRSSRKNGEEKSQEEVSAEENIQRLQADLEKARTELAESERQRDFAWQCQQTYHFR